MKGLSLSDVAHFSDAQKSRRRWYRIVVCLAVLVTFLTTYLLIIPALTYERSLICELPEHTHNSGCYGENGELICDLIEHRHTDGCYDAVPTDEDPYICGITEHTHTDGCYFDDGTLKCTLAEHIHTDECLASRYEGPPLQMITATRINLGATGTRITSASGLSGMGSGRSYYLDADITVTSTVNISSNCTLDLNGHIIYVNADRLFNVSGGTFTIIDSKAQSSKTETADVSDPCANLASFNYSTHKLTYYVTETAVKNASVGSTAETVKRVEVTSAGMIVGAQTRYNANTDSNSGNNVNLRFMDISGGTVNLEGGYICNFKSSSNDGGAIRITGGTLNIKGSVLAANAASRGAAVNAGGSATVNMTAGVLTGNEATGDGGAGFFGEGSAKIYVKGGYITNNYASSHDYWNGGGGCLLSGGSWLYLSDGYITGNRGGGGGGIKTWQDWGYNGSQKNSGGSVEMTGGFVTANSSTSAEGGGMNINAGGYLRVTGGYITNNKAGGGVGDTSFQDWGGGGLFCSENSATIYIENALVTENSAGGFGGGVAGCSTGRIVISAEGGAGIFDNSAEGTQMSGNASTKNEDHIYAASDPVFMSRGYQDYYCALGSAVTGGMLGGGAERWSGSADGAPISSSSSSDVLTAAGCMGLTSNATDVDREAAKQAAHVYFNGNESPTHGGGILANGYLVMGNTDSVMNYARLRLNAGKTLTGPDGKGVSLEGRNFKFYVNNSYGDTVSIGTADSGGTINFDRQLPIENAGTFTYYIFEMPPEGEINKGVIPDTSYYKLEVTAVKEDAGKVPWTNTTCTRIKITAIKATETTSGTVTYNVTNPEQDDTHAVSVDFTGGRKFKNYITDAAKISFAAQKSYVGGNTNKPAVTVTLLKDGQPVGTKTLNSQNQWKCEWSDLDPDANYTISETPATGYVPSYSYSYDNTFENVNGPTNEASIYQLVGNYFVPAGSLTSGEEYMIVSPEGDKALYVSSGHEDAVLSSSDTADVTQKTGSITLSNKTYTSWYEAGSVDDRCVFMFTDTSNQSGYAHKCLSCVGTGSWLLVQEADGNFLKTTNSGTWSSDFRINGGHLQGQVEWERANAWRYVIWTGSTFSTDTRYTNLVYTKVSATKKKVVITNTPESSVSYGLNIKKTGDNDEVLSGASFTLKKGTSTLRFKYDSVNKRYTYTTSTQNSVQTLTTDTSGYIRISGLPGGTYTLTETSPPEGYSVISPMTVTLDASVDGQILNLTVTDGAAGTILPSTGASGIKQDLLYICGSAMILSAAVYCVILKKRKRGSG